MSSFYWGSTKCRNGMIIKLVGDDLIKMLIQCPAPWPRIYCTTAKELMLASGILNLKNCNGGRFKLWYEMALQSCCCGKGCQCQHSRTQASTAQSTARILYTSEGKERSVMGRGIINRKCAPVREVEERIWFSIWLSFNAVHKAIEYIFSLGEILQKMEHVSFEVHV